MGLGITVGKTSADIDVTSIVEVVEPKLLQWIDTECEAALLENGPNLK